MSIIYRSSLLFSQPSHYTISHMEVQDALYHHKKQLQINLRSTSRDLNYKTQRLSARQVRTIENLSQKTRTYSLNTLLRTYHSRIDNYENARSHNHSPFKNERSNKKYFETIDAHSNQQSAFICPQKLKLFKAGVNYRSNQRARGAGVKKINIEDLKTYFDRCPQEQIDFKQLKKHQAIRKNSKIQPKIPQPNSKPAFKASRIQSSRNFLN